MTTTTAQPVKSFDYRTAATTVLKQLKRERDRQILAKRFGFENGKRQTLEEIGRTFGITRERVRQIEKSTLIKISQLALPEVTQTNELLTRYLEQQGGIVASIQATEQLGAATASDQQAVIFMATLVPDVVVIDEDDQVRAALALADKFDQATVRQEVAALAAAVAAVGKPVSIEQLAASVGKTEDSNVVLNLAGISKGLAELDGQWGLLSWPSVNPKSIRDKTYLVLGKHGKPLHFTEISKHIADSSFTRRSVTVQAAASSSLVVVFMLWPNGAIRRAPLPILLVKCCVPRHRYTKTKSLSASCASARFVQLLLFSTYRRKSTLSGSPKRPTSSRINEHSSRGYCWHSPAHWSYLVWLLRLGRGGGRTAVPSLAKHP
jgi:hypothetical protein